MALSPDAVCSLYGAVRENDPKGLHSLLDEINPPEPAIKNIIDDHFADISPRCYEQLDTQLDAEAHRNSLARAARFGRMDLIEHALDNDWLRPKQNANLITHMLIDSEHTLPVEQLKLLNRVGQHATQWDGRSMRNVVNSRVDLSKLPDLLRSVANAEEFDHQVAEAAKHRSPAALRALQEAAGMTADDIREQAPIALRNEQKPTHASMKEFCRTLYERFGWTTEQLSNILSDFMDATSYQHDLVVGIRQFRQSEYADNDDLRSKLQKRLRELMNRAEDEMEKKHHNRRQVLIESGVLPEGGGYDELQVVIEHGSAEQVRHWLDKNDDNLRAADMYRLAEAAALTDGYIDVAFNEYDVSSDQVRRAVKRYTQRFVKPDLDEKVEPHHLNRSGLYAMADNPGPDQSLISCVLDALGDMDLSNLSKMQSRIETLLKTTMTVTEPPAPEEAEECWTGLVTLIDQSGLATTRSFDGSVIGRVAQVLINHRLFPDEEQLDKLGRTNESIRDELEQQLPRRARNARQAQAKETLD